MHEGWPANVDRKGALAQNSVRYSNFEDQNDVDWIDQIERGVDGSGVKSDRLQEWNDDWETFCGWVVDEFEDKYSLPTS